MKAHLANAAYGAMDYLAYPLSMLLLAPQILHALGTERYGVWAIACAVLNTGAILASGFGDANIHAVAVAIGNGKQQRLIASVRNSLAIHICLGALFTGTCWLAAPILTRLSVPMQSDLAGDCLWSLRTAAIVIGIRAIETVCVSTQRAFGRYGAAIRFGVAARITSVLAAAVIPLCVKSLFPIMLFALTVNLISLCVQWHALRTLLGISRITPSLHLAEVKGLLRFGGYTWAQSAAAVVFGQVDRIYAGMALGAAALTPYVFCVQLTQPIYGIAAASWHFLFPYIANHGEGKSIDRIRRMILIATAINSLFVAMSLLLTIHFAGPILRLWAGQTIAVSAAPLLPLIAWGAALPALAVTGTYSMLAMGRPQPVAALSVLGGLAMLIALPLLGQRFGVVGIASSRIAYGAVAVAIFIPLAHRLAQQKQTRAHVSPISTFEEA